MNYEDFGRLLAQLMASHGMSGAELGRQLGGLDRSSVTRWKTGRERPEPATVTKIADLFGYDRLELLKLARWLPGEPQPQPDAYRRLKHEQLDEWLSSVGDEHETVFWDALKVEAAATAEVIRRVARAVPALQEPAVSTTAISELAPHRRRKRRDGRTGAGGQNDPLASVFSLPVAV